METSQQFLSKTSNSILFWPDSYMTLFPVNNTALTSISQILIFVINVGCKLPYIWQIVLLFFGLLLYVASIFYAIQFGGFLSQKGEGIFVSVCLAGSINLLICIITVILKKQITDVFIVIFVIVLIISFVVGMIGTKKRRLRCLFELDRISNNETDDVLESKIFRKPQTFLNYVIVGMEFTHPICINWSIFKIATERWPDNPEIWCAFGKFASIYPEETRSLIYILSSVSKLKGAACKKFVANAASILRQREGTLCINLKTKINVFQKSLNDTKQKLRSVWDLILQGNTSELEIIMVLAYQKIQQTQKELERLLLEYPNNRFVFRCQVRFTKEILADSKLNSDYLEKLKQLQRGVLISPDRAYLLGLRANPQLPPKIMISKDTTGTTEDVTTTSETIELDEDLNSAQLEQTMYLRERIDTLKISLVRNSHIFVPLIVFAFVVIPSVAMLIYNNLYIENLMASVPFELNIANIRSFTFMLTTMVIHDCMESLPSKNPADPAGTKLIPPPTISLGFKLDGFSNFYTTKQQMKVLSIQLTGFLQELSNLRTFQQNDPDIDVVRNLVFGKEISYSYYYDCVTFITEKVSISNVIADLTKQVSAAVETVAYTDSTYEGSILLNTGNNQEHVANATNFALAGIDSYVKRFVKAENQIFLVFEILGPVVTTIIFLVELVIINRGITNLAKTAFDSLVSIPKSTISAVAESYRTIRKESDLKSSSNDYSEITKQEENTLKMLHNISQDQVSNSGRIPLYVGIALEVIGSIVCYVVFCELFIFEGNGLNTYLCHVNYITGAYSYSVGSFLSTLYALLSAEQYNIIDPDPTYLFGRLESRLQLMTKYYNNARFGDEDIDSMPLMVMEDGLRAALGSFGCTDKMVSTAPQKLEDLFFCMIPDQQIDIVKPLFKKWFSPYVHGYDIIRSTHSSYNSLYELVVIILYDSFFQDITQNIVSIITNLVVGQRGMYIGLTVVGILLCFFGMVLIIIDLNMIKYLMKFAMSFTLHCPTSVILSTPKIMLILSGVTSSQKSDESNKDDSFFRNALMQLQDLVLITNINGDLTFVNNSAKSFFGLEDKDITQINFQTLIDSETFAEHPKINFTKKEEFKLFTKNNKTLKLNNSLQGNNGIVMIKDISQEAELLDLIESEKNKKRALLQTILPAPIAKKVENDEGTISIEVQSASIIFIHINNFKSVTTFQDPSDTIKVLNKFFGKLDTILGTFTTLTKVRTFANTYFAAGGLFSTVSQPTNHTKETVDFGLKAVDLAKQMVQDKEMEQETRVGINTGGPIVIGALGCKSPVFQVIGATVNLAEEMEKTAPPMSVQISRPVYELIYGGNFIVKEKGETEISTGTTFTYLVTGITHR